MMIPGTILPIGLPLGPHEWSEVPVLGPEAPPPPAAAP